MKKIKILPTIMFVALLSFVTLFAVKPASAQTFSDVSKKDLYYDAVEHLAKVGILSTESGKFNPDNQVTRGQLAKMLAESLKLDTTNVKNPNFKDVPTTHQYYPYIAALANKKVINGYTDGTFGVNKPVTKAHLAKFIVNGFEMPIRSERKQSFSDVTPGTETDKYAGTLYFYRITYTPKYNPNSNARRHVVASFIYDAMMKKDSIDHQVEIKLPHTVTGKTQEYYKHTSTKADANVDILKNVFVLLPNGAERAFYLPFTNNKHKKVQFEVNEKNEVVHISLTDKVATKFKSYYGVGYVTPEYLGVTVQSVTYENVSNPKLPAVTGKKGVNIYGRDEWNADLYAAHGDATFTDLYKLTIALSDGQVVVEYYKNFDKTLEINANKYYPTTENGVFFSSDRFDSSKPFTVEGPDSYFYNDEIKWNESLTGADMFVGFGFKEPGIYKVIQNGKVVIAAELIEVNGQIYGKDIYFDLEQ